MHLSHAHISFSIFVKFNSFFLVEDEMQCGYDEDDPG